MQPPDDPFSHHDTVVDDEIEVLEAEVVIDDAAAPARPVHHHPAPEAAVPGSVAPEIVAPEIVAPEAAVPEIAVPEISDAVESPTGPGVRPARRPPVDPRIRARRIAVAREQGRRRLRFVLVGLTVLVVAGSAWLLVQSPILDVDHIVITGVPNDRIAAIAAASGVHRHDPLLLVSTGAVARRLDRLPGIGSVHVWRDLPGTLRISAREQGVALWARVRAGGVALIGHDGRVQRVAPAPPPGVIELRGLAHVPAPGGAVAVPAVVDVMRELPPALAARVGAISAAGPDDVRLYLVVGGEVRLGDLTRVHDKGVAAEAVIERMGCALTYVDVQSIASPVALQAPGARCNP
jgi:cell division septal protein FtsQ